MTCVATTAATVFSHFSMLSHGSQETIILYKKYRELEMAGFVSPLHFVKKKNNPHTLIPALYLRKSHPAMHSPPSVSPHIIPSHLTKALPLAFRKSGA